MKSTALVLMIALGGTFAAAAPANAIRSQSAKPTTTISTVAPTSITVKAPVATVDRADTGDARIRKG